MRCLLDLTGCAGPRSAVIDGKTLIVVTGLVMIPYLAMVAMTAKGLEVPGAYVSTS